MGRHKNEATGVVVSVDDSKDDRFTSGWVPVDADEPKRPAKQPTKKSN